MASKQRLNVNVVHYLERSSDLISSSWSTGCGLRVWPDVRGRYRSIIGHEGDTASGGRVEFMHSAHGVTCKKCIAYLAKRKTKENPDARD